MPTVGCDSTLLLYVYRELCIQSPWLSAGSAVADLA